MTDEWGTQGTTFVPYAAADDDRDAPYLDGPLARSAHDLPAGPLLRFHAYRTAWDKCLRRIQDIVHGLHSATPPAVLAAVHAAYAPGVALPAPELASLVVSSADRASLHGALARIAAGLGAGAFVARLADGDCPSAAAALKALIAGFVAHAAAPKMRPAVSPAAYDLDVLKAWYRTVQEEYGADVPAMVVLVHDLPAIDPVVLRDVLEICSLHVPDLPLVFIFGTSDPDLLNSVLPRSVLACLRIEKYVLPWNVKTLEHVIRETFFSPRFTPDVMLGPVGFEMVFEEFKRHNATLSAVLSTLQLLHIQHFYNPLSFLVDSASDDALYEVNDSPPEAWRPFFKLLRQYCIPALLVAGEETDDITWSEILPQEVIRTAFAARSTFRARGDRMKVALSVLETVLTFARSHGMKVPALSFEKLGLDALRGSLDGESVRGVTNLMRQMGLNEVTALLEELYHLLHNLPSHLRNDAVELKQKVVIVKGGVAEETVVDFVDFLQSYFNKSFISFEDISCLDIWWTGETSIPHSPLNPNPHLSIVTALLRPQEYLGWSASTEPRQRRELSSLPDACILFRRYVESGKLINVYDWYDSFSVAVEEETPERDEDSTMDVDESPSKGKGKGNTLKRKQPDDRAHERHAEARKREIQARFMRSMHELEFVGFLKPTGRKADHVVKTAFDVLD